MNNPHPLTGQEILFTRQRHEAKRAGLHWDYRLVLGEHAYSWATKKEMPEPGNSIILFEQPVHDRSYALSPVVDIPEGQYGHGTTTLDWIRKAKVSPETEEGKLFIHSGDEKFLLRKLDPVKYGQKAWLFKNLSVDKYTRQKTSALNPEIEAKFKPDLTPDQMARLGVLRHKGSQYGEGTDKDNFFGVRASLDTWPDKWHNELHPQGWYQRYQGYVQGKRTPDDERQMKRWISFKARHLAQLQKADPTLEDLSVQPKRRQALLNWGIAPGNMNKYLTKLAKKEESSWNHPSHVLGGSFLGGVAAAPLTIGQHVTGLSVLKDVDKAMPDIADRHTVKHFMRNNNINKSNMTFEHDRSRGGSFADIFKTFKGPRQPGYVDKHLHNGLNSAFGKVKHNPYTHLDKHYIQGLGGKGYNHAITMHELGHAKDFNTGMTGLKRGLSSAKVGLKFGAGAASLGLMSNKNTEDYAAVPAAIQGAITLREEGAANVHAYKGIKAHKGAAAANKYLTKIVPKQMGSYVLAAAAPVAAAYLGTKIIKGLRGDGGKK